MRDFTTETQRYRDGAASAGVGTFADAARRGVSALTEAGVETARLDAEVLLAHAAGLDRSGLFARLRDEVPGAALIRFDTLIARRARREPVAYIVGEKEFHSLAFRVTPDVLIPRPETELLVDEALRRAPANGRVLDVGTGSGCISVSLAVRRPDLRLTACDISAAALAVAVENAHRHAVDERIELVESDLFDGFAVDRRWEVIVSNPPYVADAEPLAPELAWEPVGALRAGLDGLSVIRLLVPEAAARLAPGGTLMFEIGSAQAQSAVSIAERAGLKQIAVQRDLSGLPRLVVAVSSES